MLRNTFLASLTAMTMSSAYANITEDAAAIKKMAGCFEVTFSFEEVETREGSQASQPYEAKATEWVALEEIDDQHISLQHILKVGPGFQIKHWRQEWQYMSTDGLVYSGPQTWQNVQFEEQSGHWVQRVYQVDDGPRYQCSAAWSHEETSSWTCDSWAPLPRREYSKRSDYQVLERGNTHEITSIGWLHHQQNNKLQLSQASDNIITVGKEVGLNTYKRIDDSHCISQEIWWTEKRQSAWSAIQQAWHDVLKQSEFVTLHEEPSLRNKLNGLVRKHLLKPSSLDAEAVYQEAASMIAEHIHAS